MPGSTGPTVMLQMPCSSFCSGWVPTASHTTETFSAFGARKRNVIRPSGCTSGETSLRWGGSAAGLKATTARTTPASHNTPNALRMSIVFSEFTKPESNAGP